MTERSDQHIGVLDGLRAMAVLLVLFSHGLGIVWLDMSQPYMPIGHFDFAAFLRNGWLGVDLFFVLSGFLITGQLLDSGIGVKKGQRDVIRRYFRRRIYRIVPAYYAVLTFTTIVFMRLDPLQRDPEQWAESYIPHLLFLQNYFYVEYHPLFWSLAVEFQFYLLAPFFILALLRIERPSHRYLAVLALALFLAVLRMLAVLHWQPATTNFNYWFFNIRILLPFSLDGIFGGMLCNLLWHDERARNFLSRRLVSNSLFIGGLLLYYALTCWRPMENGVTFFEKTFLTFFVSTAFCCMLLGLLGGSIGKGLFSSRPLRHIALVSYSMYLIHLIVMRDVFDGMAPLALRFHSHFATFFPAFGVFVAVTVFFSTLMYEFVEKPFIQRAKRHPPVDYAAA